MRVSSRTDQARTALSVMAELDHCAKVYLGAMNTPEDVFEEGVAFIISRFGHIGVFELREAFRLAAAGQLDLDSAAFRAYYGMFTIAGLGAILQAYDRYRAEVVKALRRAEVAELALVSDQNRILTWNTAAWEAARRESLLTMDFPRSDNPNDAGSDLDERAMVEYVTAYDYDWLTRSGQLDVSAEEKKAAWEDARLLTLADYKNLALSSRNFHRALSDIESGKPNEGFEARRIAAAKRLLVLRWVMRMRAEKD